MRDIWKQEQMRLLGPAWDASLTLKMIAYKRPITIAPKSSDVTSTALCVNERKEIACGAAQYITSLSA